MGGSLLSSETPARRATLAGGAVYDACNLTSPTPADNDEPAAWAFWASCAIASAISFALKLIAHVLQQKMIGEMLSHRVGIRAMCKVNTPQMKAVKHILLQPGVTLAKVDALHHMSMCMCICLCMCWLSRKNMCECRCRRSCRKRCRCRCRCRCRSRGWCRWSVYR